MHKQNIFYFIQILWNHEFLSCLAEIKMVLHENRINGKNHVVLCSAYKNLKPKNITKKIIGCNLITKLKK